MVIPTILTYEKSSAPSSGLMFGRTYDGEKLPLLIGLLRGRGAQTDHSAGHGEKDTDLGEWLPLRQDYCQLPHNAPELVIEFAIKYLPRSLTPHSCNDPEWFDLLEQLAQLYAEKSGYLYQAYCQIDALFQGLPFWRNNDGEALSLSIINISDKILPPYLFKGLPARADTLTNSNKAQFYSLVETIAQALSGKRDRLRLRVIATLEKDALEEVFPSEEFIEKLSESKKEYLHRQKRYQKAREYAFYKIGDIQQAMLHPTKIGAGLRWDRWCKSGIETPVSVYGLIAKGRATSRGRGTKQDFYSLLSNIRDHITTLQEFDGNIFAQESIEALGEIHFIMANLIKGGVYNRESPKKKTKTTSEEIDLSNP